MTAKERNLDPGDAVPPGVAPVSPVPLTEEDRRVKRKLEELGTGDDDDPSEGRPETEGPESPGA